MNLYARRLLLLILSGISLALSCSSEYEDKLGEKSGTLKYLETEKATINVNIADVKKEPRKHAERASQALYNESVDVMEIYDGYARIRQKDGYEGWIRTYYLGDYHGKRAVPPYYVNSNLAPAYKKPDPDSDRRTMFVYGTEMSGSVENGFLKVESERYGAVYVSLSDLSGEYAAYYSGYPDSVAIRREAGKFIGAPYLWGGKSFYGIDCSGLTQMVMRRFGVDLPRDSRDQIKQGVEIERDSVKAGDLLFFPNHVGLAVTKYLMIHSTGRNGGVAYNSLDPESPIYSEYHDKNFVTARRVISEEKQE